MRNLHMENHFNTPAEVVDLSIKACENKTKLPVGKMILLGIMAGFLSHWAVLQAAQRHTQ